MNTTDLYELSADEIDQVSGGEYKEYFNFKVAGMHVWGGSYDGHAFTCVSDGKSGSCKIEGAK